MENESNEIRQIEQPPLLISIEKRQQSIVDACSDSIQYSSLLSSLQKSITKDSRILACTPVSVLDAMLACAKLGIDPSGEHNTGWFIRYGSELKLMIGYNGYIDLITRSGKYQQVEAEVVYEGEKYEVHRGTRNEIIHEIDFDIRNNPESKITSSYAVARGNGCNQFVALSRTDIDIARSASKNKSLWEKHRAEMCKKTSVRNLAKWMVLDSIGRYASAISDEGDGYEHGNRRVSNEAQSASVDDLRKRIGSIKSDDSEPVEEAPERNNTQEQIPFDPAEISAQMDKSEATTKGIEE
jgi:recombination protein RecT